MILALAGLGEMAELYPAGDTKLKGDSTLKALPEASGRTPANPADVAPMLRTPPLARQIPTGAKEP